MSTEPFEMDFRNGLCSATFDGGDVVISLLNSDGENLTWRLSPEDARELAVSVLSVSGGSRLRNAWRLMVGKR